MNLKSCPDQESLQRLPLGKIAVHRSEPLEQHLPPCDDGSAVVDTISANDQLTAEIGAPDLLSGNGEFLAEAIERDQRPSHQIAAANPDETLDGEPIDLEPKLAPSSDSAEQADDVDVEAYANFLAAAEQPDELGRLGGYRVLEVTGVGGMGVVYRAEDPKLNRAVALKVMKPTSAVGKTARQRFVREAQAAAAIDHDNVVTIYEVGADRSVGFIAMQFLCGESLQDKLAREDRLDPMEAARVGREVAAGLAAAHRRGLIHRDIKPDNIWLEEETGRAKILDFGLARSHDADSGLTQAGMVMGTPRYMSPEQAKAEAVDHRCDLFSLGSVLYHMVSGESPFEGGNLLATLIKVSQGEFKPIERVVRGLNPELASLINRLLAKDPAARPQTAQEVARAVAQMETQLEAEPSPS